MPNYTYDIAISLCSDDLEYGKKLYDALNPKLEKKFLYPEEQKKIITEHGDEFFRKIFKEEARVVVILHQKEWGKRKFTKLEKDAILDRTGQEGQGHDFIIMVPMDESTPSWYPENRIYADPNEFPIEQIARFIEYQVAQRGGEVEPLTLQEKVEDFQKRLKNKDEHLNELLSENSSEEAKETMDELIEKFQEKVKLLEDSGLPDDHKGKPMSNYSVIGSGEMWFSIRSVGLSFRVYYLKNRPEKKSSQQYHLIQELFYNLPHREKEKHRICWKHFRFNFENEWRRGWSEVIPFNDPEGHPTEYLIQDEYVIENELRIPFYDLGPVQTSEELIEDAFQELFDLYLKKYEPVLYPSKADT